MSLSRRDIPAPRSCRRLAPIVIFVESQVDTIRRREGWSPCVDQIDAVETLSRKGVFEPATSASRRLIRRTVADLNGQKVLLITGARMPADDCVEQRTRDKRGMGLRLWHVLDPTPRSS